MIKLLAQVLVFALCATPIMAQQVRNMSITDCISYATENKTAIRSLQFDEALQKLKNAEIEGLTRPQVSFSGSATGFIITPTSRSAANAFGDLFGSIYAPIKPEAIDQNVLQQIQAASANVKYNELQFALPYNVSCTLTATQILFDPNIFIALQARKGLEDLTRISTERTIQQTAYDITKAYYNVLIAEQRMSLFDNNIELVNSFYTMTSKLFKEGFAEKIDADRLLVQKNNLEVEKNKVANLVALSYQLLKFQMGMPLTDGIKLTDKLDMDKIKKDAIATELDLDKRIEVKQLKQARSLQLLDLKRQKNSNLPTVVALGNAGLSSATSSFGDLFTYKYFPQMLVGLSVQVPVYDGGARKRKIDQAKMSIAKIDNDMSTISQALTLEHSNAKTQLKNSLIAYENQSNNIQLAQNVYNVAQKKYKEGLGSSIEVMQAQSALKDAQTNYLGATFDVINFYVDLQKALGQIK
jgi:outer membrane protein